MQIGSSTPPPKSPRSAAPFRTERPPRGQTKKPRTYLRPGARIALSIGQPSRRPTPGHGLLSADENVMNCVIGLPPFHLLPGPRIARPHNLVRLAPDHPNLLSRQGTPV